MFAGAAVLMAASAGIWAAAQGHALPVVLLGASSVCLGIAAVGAALRRR